LTVQFSGSDSYDPESGPLAFLWEFGDGETSSEADPSHEYTGDPGVPTQFHAVLTITDDQSLSADETLLVSLNNTPPSVVITSPLDGMLYSMTGDTTHNLTATVTDAEHGRTELFYRWQTTLHHNNHTHSEPLDFNSSTTAIISPTGCDGNVFFYSITLTVTDLEGLSAQNVVYLYPDCGTGGEDEGEGEGEGGGGCGARAADKGNGFAADSVLIALLAIALLIVPRGKRV
jgi:hypothetical protein